MINIIPLSSLRRIVSEIKSKPYLTVNNEGGEGTNDEGVTWYNAPTRKIERKPSDKPEVPKLPFVPSVNIPAYLPDSPPATEK